MADWLEITNTYINLQTMERVGDVSRAQQQVANQMLAVEYRKQQDNALLSKLVDILVKVRQFIQDEQFLDALLSAGVGTLAFKQVYPQILDAETKLKASDIQVKLLETMRSTVSEPSFKQTLQSSLAQYLSSIHGRLAQTLPQLKQSQHHLVLLNRKHEPAIAVGKELTPIQDATGLSSKIVVFRKGQLYSVVEVNTTGTKGFYLINDYGQKWYLFFGKKGGTNLFAFFDPPLPSLEKEIVVWELCDKLFGDEFLNENLKSVQTEMLALIQQAYDHAKLTRASLASSVQEYKQLRQGIVNRALQSPQLQAHTKNLQFNTFSTKEWGIMVLIAVVIFLLIRHC
ncbi:MAG: hypothetical protein WCE90_10165 [Candidatus Zixiibacteriota bacterium]